MIRRLRALGRVLEFARQMLDLFARRGTVPQPSKLVIKAGGRVVFLDADEIDWIEAEG